VGVAQEEALGGAGKQRALLFSGGAGIPSPHRGITNCFLRRKGKKKGGGVGGGGRKRSF